MFVQIHQTVLQLQVSVALSETNKKMYLRGCPLISFQDGLRDGKACMLSIPVRVIQCGFSETGGHVKIVDVQHCGKWYRDCGVPDSEFNGERRV